MKASKDACVVYWIHLDSHKDMSVEGYIGIANNFDSRMYKHLHRTSRSGSHFGRAIILYGWVNLVKEIVYAGTREDCLKLEYKLRPDYQIGWNEIAGGEGADTSRFIDYTSRKNQGWSYDKNGIKNPFYGKRHSDEAKRKNSEAQSTKVIYSPDGIFYGFNALARFLNVHKLTAKKIAIKEGWKIEDKQKGIRVN